jgi:hypothetical protein
MPKKQDTKDISIILKNAIEQRKNYPDGIERDKIDKYIEELKRRLNIK